jgi:hypothetical protein
MCSRRDSRVAIRCHWSAAGALPRERRRWTHSHPVSSRRLSRETPAIHTMINVGRSGSIRIDPITRPIGAVPASAAFGTDASRAAADASRTGTRLCARPAGGVTGMAAAAAAASARSTWNFCAPLTTGSVSISARPMADTT